MKKRINKNLFLLFACIFLLNFVSSSCNSTQIDINTASIEELDKLEGIGYAYAGKIIANRTYDSINDLIRVSGIGDVTLNKIKEQGLACVDNGNIEEEEVNELIEEIKTENTEPELANLSPIKLNYLNSKDIKSEDNKEILKRNLSFCGIILFCIIFGLLFLLNKRKNRNEFRE